MKSEKRFQTKKNLVSLIAVFFLFTFTMQSQGAIFQVTNSADLQTALNTARTNGQDDTIKLLAATYITTGNPFSYGTASNDNKTVILSGGWNSAFTTQANDPYQTVLDGDKLNPVLQIDSNSPGVNITFIVENLTIQNGYARSGDYSGGGILTFTGPAGKGSIHLTIRDCLFQNNIAANNKSGGAIYNTGSIEIYDTKFLSNSGSSGGALVISYDADEGPSAAPIIDNCYFEDNYNYGNQGSSIYTNCALQIRNSTFKGRTDGVSSSGNGSCIWGSGGSHLNITNSTFSNITIKYWGPAIQAWYSNMDITNCLFANNHAGVGAGGDGYGAISVLSNTSNIINITNCTFVENKNSSSSYSGSGAIHNRGATMNLNNCIFWDNGTASGVYNDSGTTTMRYCLYYSGSSGKGYGVTDGGNNFSEDPLFADDNVFSLSPESPCIDAGNNNLVPADSQDVDNDSNTAELTPLDIAGHMRFRDDPYIIDTGLGTAPIVDIGAYESLPAPTAISATDGTSTNKVTITWNASPGATSYDIYKYTSDNSASSTKINPSDVTGTSYNDASAVAGTTYWYWVKAKDTTDISGFSSGDSGYRALAVITVQKCSVTAGNNNLDGISFSGSLDAAESDFTAANVAVTINSKPMINPQIFTFPITAATYKKGKFSGKVPNGTFSFDTKKQKFTFAAKKINLTGLACPFTVTITIGDYTAQTQLDETIVNGAKKLIPFQLMMDVQNNLTVTKYKLKVGKTAGTDTFTAQGTFTVDGTINITQPLVISMGSQHFTILGGVFLDNTKGVYSCKNALAQENCFVTAKFDKNKCTFTLSITKASINRPGAAAFELDCFGNSLENTTTINLN